MSITTLNRITREQTVFYNTRRERDKAEGRKPKTTEAWKSWEIDLLRKYHDKSAKYLQQYIPRGYMAIWHQLKNMRGDLAFSGEVL